MHCSWLGGLCCALNASVLWKWCSFWSVAAILAVCAPPLQLSFVAKKSSFFCFFCSLSWLCFTVLTVDWHMRLILGVLWDLSNIISISSFLESIRRYRALRFPRVVSCDINCCPLRKHYFLTKKNEIGIRKEKETEINRQAGILRESSPHAAVALGCRSRTGT